MTTLNERIAQQAQYLKSARPGTNDVEQISDTIQRLIYTQEQIDLHARDGKIRVEESGMDCDCVQYSGRLWECAATLDALEKLHDDIAEWADGPFTLTVVSYEDKIQYHSRDLALEAYENGHPHHITFDGE